MGACASLQHSDVWWRPLTSRWIFSAASFCFAKNVVWPLSQVALSCCSLTTLVEPHRWATNESSLSNRMQIFFCRDKWKMHFSLVGGLGSLLTSPFRKLNFFRHLQLNDFRELGYEHEEYVALAYNFSLRGLIHPGNITNCAPLLKFEFLSYDLSMLNKSGRVHAIKEK